MSRIKVRKQQFDFTDKTSRYWLGGSIYKTHFANTLTILFPDAEKFFVRSIKAVLPKENTVLREDALGFIGQETQHANQHQKAWDLLKSQGFEIDSFLETFKKLAFEYIEPNVSEEMRVSITAGLEHYTALMAEVALKENLFQNADLEMKELFEWHCAEEMEHKSVAFDVLKNTNPDYALRITGMVLASILFLQFATMGNLHFLIQEKKFFDWDYWKEVGNVLFFKESLLPKAFAIFLEYFDPNFHPKNRNTDEIANKYFQKETKVA